MDPISLGVAAAALVATKFGEQFAEDAGDTAWHAVERLRDLVTDRFRHEPETDSAITALTDAPTPEVQAVVAQRITDITREDLSFASEVDGLVTAARQNRSVEIVVAQAFGDARQVNIRGWDDRNHADRDPATRTARIALSADPSGRGAGIRCVSGQRAQTVSPGWRVFYHCSGLVVTGS